MSRSFTSLLPNIARLVAFSMLLIVASAAFLYVRAQARIDDEFLSLGAQMMRYGGARYQDEPRGLLINGHPFEFSSGTADGELRAVLDRYEERCKQGQAPVAGDLGSSARSSSSTPGVFRGENDAAGYVACIDFRSAPGSFLDRLSSFGRTGLLSDIGGFRYLYASRLGNATHFFALWSDTPLDIGNLLPATGDAPGHDLPGVPRPRGSRRSFSAVERETSLGIVAYEQASEGIDATEQLYRTALGAPLSRTDSAARTLVFEAPERVTTVVLSADADGGHASATILVSP